MKRKFSALLFLIVLISPPAAADDLTQPAANELLDELRSLNKTVGRLKSIVEEQDKRIRELERRQAAAPPSPAAIGSGPAAAGSPPAGRIAAAAPSPAGGPSNAFNPEIGGLLDIVAASTESAADEEGNDRLSVREAELIFGQDIDPYTRFDSTFTVSDFEEFDIEEAYVSFFGLPGDIKARLGRIRPKVGKASSVHRDVLETVDEPLVVSEYFGVEGLFRTAAETSYFLPTSSDTVTHELTAGVMEGGIGEDGALLGETRRIPTFYGHLKNYWEISDDTDLEIGGTYITGSSDDDGAYEVHAFGVDGTWTYHVTPSNKFKLQSEAYFQDRRETPDEVDGTPIDPERHPSGFYVLADYRLSPRFAVGARYDYVEPINRPEDSERNNDTGYTGYLSLLQSEFVRWRAEYQHLDFADGSDDDRIFLQGTFAFGVHKHQLN